MLEIKLAIAGFCCIQLSSHCYFSTWTAYLGMLMIDVYTVCMCEPAISSVSEYNCSSLV